MTNKLPPYFEQYLDQKFGEVNARLDNITNNISGVESRITCLESWKADLMGKLAIVSFILVLTVNMLVDWVRSKFNLK